MQGNARDVSFLADACARVFDDRGEKAGVSTIHGIDDNSGLGETSRYQHVGDLKVSQCGEEWRAAECAGGKAGEAMVANGKVETFE